MSASPIHERPYTRVEFVCAECGINCRVDFDVAGPFAVQVYKHCEKDTARILGGPILRMSEERNGTWILVSAE